MNFDVIFSNIHDILYLSYYTLIYFVPYVLIGVVIGEILKVTSWTKIIYKATTKKPVISCILAAALGIASPLCTFGTIPVAISLYTAGVSMAPLIAFIASSSLLNPQFIIYTWGQIGPGMAIGRVVSVFLIGITVGLIVSKIPSEKLANHKIQKDLSRGDEILNTRKKFNLKTFLLANLHTLEHVLFYMILGVLIANTILTVFPQKTINDIFSNDAWYSVILAAVVGVPLYQCGGGVIPLIAVFIKNGMGYGQALAFFLVGAATNAQPIISMATMLKPKAVIGYLAIVVILSLILGYLTNPLITFISHLF